MFVLHIRNLRDRSYVIYVWFCVRFEVEWRTQIAYVAFMSDLEIIRQRGGIRPLARKLGHRNHTTVQGWWVRDRIPPRDRKSTRLNSSHLCAPRIPSSACNKKTTKHITTTQ